MFINNWKVFLLIIILFRIVQAQPEAEWVKYFNGHGYQDYPYALAFGNNGNIYVAGFTERTQNPQTNLDYVTIKFDSAGNRLWFKQYNGPANRNDEIYSISVDDSEDVFVTGTVSTTGWTGIGTIKYNSNGEQKWINVYTGEPGYLMNEGKSIAVDNLGNSYITGTTQEWNGPDIKIVTIKYNTGGTQVWKKFYSDSTDNIFKAIKILIENDSNIFVLGMKQKSDGSKSSIILSYSSTGNLEWVVEIPNNKIYSNIPNSFVLGSDNGIYLSASSIDSLNKYDYLTAKIGASGVIEWLKFYNGNHDLDNSPVAITSDNSGIFVTGNSTDSIRQGDDLIYISVLESVKYDYDGNILWFNKYKGTIDTTIRVIDSSCDDAQNFYIAGYSASGTSLFDDIVIVKYDPFGNEDWHTIFDYNGLHRSEQPFRIKAAGENEFAVTGISIDTNPTAMADIITIKYSPTVLSINNETDIIPKEFSLFQNYPNPFNPSTKIKFTIPAVERFAESLNNAERIGNSLYNITLKVYDVLGNEVATLVNEEKSPGTYEVNFDAGNLTSGVYFYKLQAGNFVQTKKMLLLK